MGLEIARLNTHNAPRHAYLTRTSICQPTPRASLTPVSSSCCTGLRHHAACHHALRHRPPRHPSHRANDPPRPHRRTATQRAPQRTIALQAALTSTTPHPHGRTTAFGATMRPGPATERRSNARPRLHPSPASRRAPQRAFALQAELTSATFTTTTTLATASHTPAPQTPATRARNTHHTEPSPAYFRGMHRCTSGRSCVQLRADDPLDSCVGCIVLVQRVCVLCVLYVWMSSVMLSIHFFTHICPC
jgi:hypothetical protein